METMGTAYCEQAHRRTIKKLEVNEEISMKALHQWYMDWIFGYDSHYDRCTEGGYTSQENGSDISEKDTGATKPEG